MKIIWIVGQAREGGAWDFQGVFSTEEKAIAACRSDQYFIGPALIDEDLPHDAKEWDGSYYPLDNSRGMEES